MPACYTHLYFAMQLRDKLSYAPNAVIRLYPDAYRLGALGADVFLPLGRLSAEMDVADPYELFEQTGAHIYESGSKCQLAYMLGMLTHYLLDSRINPYQHYLAENGVGHYFDDQKDMIEYEKIRSSVDLHIANAFLDGKMEELRQNNITEDVADDIAKLYERSVCAVVQHAIQKKQVFKCLQEHDLGPDPVGYNLPELDYLNRNHREWETVRNGQWTSTLSLEELLDKLQPIAIGLIEDYMLRVRSAYELNRRAFQINHLGILI